MNSSVTDRRRHRGSNIKGVHQLITAKIAKYVVNKMKYLLMAQLSRRR
ncbi:MAG: hypothetical protein ACYTXA_12960 [Nostoc sp.]